MSSIGSFLEKKIKKLFWTAVSPKTEKAELGPLRPGKSLSILAIRPDRLGDFILSVPAIRMLQKSMGSPSKLTIVAGERNGEVARFFFPDSRVLVFRKSILRRLPLFFRVWRGRYDAAFDFHSYPFSTTSALITLWSGSVRRVGFWNDGESAELSRKTFNLGVPKPKDALHEKDKSLLLTKRLFQGRSLGPSRDFSIPPVPAKIRSKVAVFYKTVNLGKEVRVIGLHPTLQKEDNRWSLAKYSELIQGLDKNQNFKFVLVHGRGEEGELKRFSRGMGTFSNVFALPSSDVLFILEAAKRFDLFVGGDSGVTHLAALVTRVLAIFGPSDPKRWGPLNTGHGTPLVLRKTDKLCDSVQSAEVAREIKRIFTTKYTKVTK